MENFTPTASSTIGIIGNIVSNKKNIENKGTQEAINSSIDLKNQIIQDRQTPQTKLPDYSMTHLSNVSSKNSRKVLKGHLQVNNLNVSNTTQELTPAQILYGKREKTQKEIDLKNSYPQYIEDFTPAQILYADKEITKKAEHASKTRREQPIELESLDKPGIKPRFTQENKGVENLNNTIESGKTPNSIKVDPVIETESAKPVIDENEEILSRLEREFQGMELKGEVVEFFNKIQNIKELGKKELIKILKNLSPECKEQIRYYFNTAMKYIPAKTTAF